METVDLVRVLFLGAIGGAIGYFGVLGALWAFGTAFVAVDDFLARRKDSARK